MARSLWQNCKILHQGLPVSVGSPVRFGNRCSCRSGDSGRIFAARAGQELIILGEGGAAVQDNWGEAGPPVSGASLAPLCRPGDRGPMAHAPRLCHRSQWPQPRHWPRHVPQGGPTPAKLVQEVGVEVLVAAHLAPCLWVHRTGSQGWQGSPRDSLPPCRSHSCWPRWPGRYSTDFTASAVSPC